MLKILLPALPLLLASSVFASAVPMLPPPLPAAAALPLPPVPLTATFSRGLALPEFTRLVLEDVLRVPFVLPPELLNSADVVGVSVRALDKKAALAVLSDILTSRGFSLRPGLVYTVTKLPAEARRDADPEPRELLTYRPRYRSVSSFAEQLPGLFPRAYFSFARRQSGNSSQSDAQLTATEKREKDADPIDVFYAHVPVSQVAAVKAAFSALDVPVAQVRIRAALYEVNTSAVAGSGVSMTLNLLNDKLKLSLGSPLDAAASTLSFSVPSVSAVFQSLDGDSRFKSVSAPQLLAASGKEAVLQVGASVPVLAAATAASSGQVTQSVDYKEVGTILKLKPEVHADAVTLDVRFELSDAVKTTTGVQASPTVVKRMFQATSVLTPGQVAVLGGLLTHRASVSSSSFFGFKTNDSSDNSRAELVLVVYAEKL